MSDECTPDTRTVKWGYQLDAAAGAMAGRIFEEAGIEFDRWLATHDAEIRTDRWRARDVKRELAKAWDEGWITRNFCAIAFSGSVRPMTTNPYRTDVPHKGSK